MLEMSSRTELIVLLYIHEQVPIAFLFVCLFVCKETQKVRTYTIDGPIYEEGAGGGGGFHPG